MIEIAKRLHAIGMTWAAGFIFAALRDVFNGY